MKKINLKVYEGEKYPFGFGFAWRNWESRSDTVFPVPFNHLARCVRELYIWLAKPQLNQRDHIYHEAYQVGKKDAEKYYEKKIKQINEEWSRTFGLAILNERTSKNRGS